MAFVMINAVPGQKETVLNNVKKIDFVTEAHMLDIEYDVVAVVKTEADADFPRTLLRIRTTEGVSDVIFLETLE